MEDRYPVNSSLMGGIPSKEEDEMKRLGGAEPVI